jgi:hypothetical protein
MCIAMRRYILCDPNANAPGLADATREQIKNMFATTISDDGDKHHSIWLDAILNGIFTVCGKVNIDDYYPLGKVS